MDQRAGSEITTTRVGRLYGPRTAWLIVVLAVTALIASALHVPPALPSLSAWVLVLPAAVLVATWQALLTERRARERLAFLYDATHALTSSNVEGALLEVLGRSREGFGAEFAEAVLLPSAGAPRRTRITPAGAETMVALDPEAGHALRLLAAAEAGDPVRLVEAGRTSKEVDRYLEASGVRGPAMLAILHGEERPLGVIIVGNRPAVDGPFSGADLQLLAKLAATVSASLAHDSLEQDFDRLESLQSQLEHMAFHDPLTSLPNRARFTESVSHALARREAFVAALFVDLDDFKTVNDSMGHRAGDELLVAVGERLRACLRAHDTPARLGGDEFAVLVEDAESMDVVLEIAERILESLSDPFVVGEGEVRIAASIGVATSLEGVRRADDLLRNADLAMYRAKGQGKGCVELYEAQMHANAVERHELKSELQSAIETDQFVVLYQPVADLATGRIEGVEALVRWQHPRLGLVAPDAFIALAEEAGLISLIGRTVFAQACERLALWRRASIAGATFSLSLNLSVREFQDAELVDALTDAAKRAGVPTEAITLEITESAIMADADEGVARMEALKAAGFRLALDDFGTGYSSLGHLRRFPIDVLKVAKPFVDHIADRPEDSAFLGSILDLARTLNLDVVVEGVETAAQARILLDLGVRRVQGFVFSRPVEDRALSALLTVAPLRGFAGAGGAAPDLVAALAR